jgi:teichuronic acid biosynthesis glycosyltransferase TuaC
MKPRRILIFSLAYYPRFIGGAEVAVKEITNRISAAEAVFDMVTIGDGRGLAEETIGNVRIHRVFGDMNFISKLLFPFAAYFKAKRLHKENAYDATWSIMANRAGFAALFFKWAFPKVPFILTLQEGDPLDYPKQRARFVYPLFKYIFTKADRIQTISVFLADWAKTMGAKCPATVVPNGIDYEHFSKPIDSQQRKKIRSDLGFSDTDIVLVTAGRLVHKNAVDDIISALALLDPAFKFLNIGTGADEKALKEQALKLKVSDRIVWKGFVPHAELPAYLQSSEIFVRPSRSEGLGNSFLEAMAAGIPIIATLAGGIVDFLKDGETGLACDIDNPHSIAQKVTKLAKDRESREYIIAQAREMVKQKYEWSSSAKRMKEVLLN